MMDETNNSPADKSARRAGGRTIVGIALAAAAFGAGVYFRDPIVQFASGRTAVASSATRNVNRTVDAGQLWTCSMHPQVIQDHAGICPICHMALTPLTAGAHMSSHIDDASGGTVTIDPVIVQRMGVRIAPVERRKLTRIIRAVGILKETEPLHHDVNLRVSGWVETLYANVDGMPVKEGQPLFDLYSPELNVAIDELIGARKQLDASQDASARRMYETTQSKLSRMGLTDSQIEAVGKLPRAPRTVPILSPTSGHVMDKTIFAGGAVKAGDLVLRVTDPSRMWADVQVFEDDLPFVRIGLTAAISTPSSPGTVFSGEISFIHPHLDMMTRSAMVRVVLPNPDHELRDGMYASAEIAATIADDAIVVPREAVIDTGTRQLAFLWKGNGRFEPRELKVGASDENGSVQVLDGLRPGDEVVTSGQFLIDSESRMEEAVQKMLRDRLAVPAPLPAEAKTLSPTSPPISATRPASEAHQKEIDAVVRDYLALSSRLGAIQGKDEPVDMQALVHSANDLASAATIEEVKTRAAAIAVEAKAMSRLSLSEQRGKFADLSAAVIALADKAPPSSNIAKVVFVAHCPMAKSGAGAEWLQTTDSLANPFFAKSMKECGSITRRIESK